MQNSKSYIVKVQLTPIFSPKQMYLLFETLLEKKIGFGKILNFLCTKKISVYFLNILLAIKLDIQITWDLKLMLLPVITGVLINLLLVFYLR